MQTYDFRKYINLIDQPKKDGLFESVIKKDPIYEEFSKIGQLLIEFKLTEPEIKELFKQIEQGVTAGGDNRTLVGKGKDVVTNVASAVASAFKAVENAFVNNSYSEGVNVAIDKLVDTIKSGVGGKDSNVMQAIYRYRLFAKEHPYFQAGIHAGLVALAGLASGGSLIPVAMGVRFFDSMLKGNKLTKAAWDALVTGGLAYGVSQAGDAYDTLKDKLNPNPGPDPSVTPTPGPNPTPPVPSGHENVAQGAGSTANTGDPTQGMPGTQSGVAPVPDVTTYVIQPNDVLSKIAEKYGTSVEAIRQANPWIGNVDVIPANKIGTELVIPNVPADTYAGGVGTAADTMSKIQSGVYPDSEISRRAAERAGIAGTPATAPYSGPRLYTAEALDYLGIKVAPIALSKLLDHEAINLAKRINESVGKGNTPIPAYLTTEGVEKIFQVVERYQRDFFRKIDKMQLAEAEDPMVPRDSLPRQLRPTRPLADLEGPAAEKKPGMLSKMWQGIKNIGHQFTTKQTAEKLYMNWKIEGSKTDTEDIYKFLIGQKVPDAVIRNIYKQMELPEPKAAPAQAPATGGATATTATGKAGKQGRYPETVPQSATQQHTYNPAATQSGAAAAPAAAGSAAAGSAAAGPAASTPFRIMLSDIIETLPTLDFNELRTLQKAVDKLVGKTAKPRAAKSKSAKSKAAPAKKGSYGAKIPMSTSTPAVPGAVGSKPAVPASTPQPSMGALLRQRQTQGIGAYESKEFKEFKKIMESIA